jgi:hypothetical protein
VEAGDADRELRRVAADLGEAGEPRIPVEGGVLHALGHHHAAGLLEALRRRMLGVLEDREQALDGGREIWPVPRRELRGLVQVLRAERQVRAVHGEAREQLGHRVGDLGQAFLDGGGVGELPVESKHLGPQDAVGDRALRAVDHLGPVGRRPAAQPGVEFGERRLAGGIDEHAVDVGERVVPRGARGRPARRHPLVALEDLLDEDVRAAGHLGQPSR